MVRLSAPALLSLAAFAALVACGGDATFDRPDPKACASGHGCPMAVCVCLDGSVVLDTTCELGKCLATQAVCNDRCVDFGGPQLAFASTDDDVPIPACDTFCTRSEINGCELGCDTMFSECHAPATCSPTANAFWSCAIERGVMSCPDNALRIEGCDASSFAFCE